MVVFSVKLITVHLYIVLEEFEEFVLLKKMSSRAGVFGDSQQLEATSVYQAADS